MNSKDSWAEFLETNSSEIQKKIQKSKNPILLSTILKDQPPELAGYCGEVGGTPPKYALVPLPDMSSAQSTEETMSAFVWCVSVTDLNRVVYNWTKSRLAPVKHRSMRQQTDDSVCKSVKPSRNGVIWKP